MSDHRVDIFMDGNCGCALLGRNLQEGEAEFVCVDDAPTIHSHIKDKERWAMAQAYKRLCERLGRGKLPYGYPYGENE